MKILGAIAGFEVAVCDLERLLRAGLSVEWLVKMMMGWGRIWKQKGRDNGCSYSRRNAIQFVINNRSWGSCDWWCFDQQLFLRDDVSRASQASRERGEGGPLENRGRCQGDVLLVRKRKTAHNYTSRGARKERQFRAPMVQIRKEGTSVRSMQLVRSTLQQHHTYFSWC